MRLFAISAFALIALPSIAQSSFNYKAKLQPVEKEDWYAIPLSSSIFPEINRQYSDIRIYQLNGKDTIEVPYVLRTKNDQVKESTVELPVLNKSKKDGKLYLTFKLRKGDAVNYLDLDFDESNFNGTVTLEGSHDQLQWFEVIKNQRILSIKNEYADFESSTIYFPLSNYTFLRATVSADRALTFSSSSFKTLETKPGNYRETPLTLKMQEDKKSKQSVGEIVFQAYQPVTKIKVNVSQSGDYYRAFSLESLRDSAQMPNKTWMYYYDQVVSGYLTSFVKNEFEFPEILTRKLRLTVYNADNAPISITSISAEGPVVELVAKLKPGENFLFYGNPSLSSPSYDLVHFENQIPEQPQKLGIQSAEKLTKEKEKVSPLLENKYWLWGAMGVVIVLLGFATIRMMGKR